jgi:putative ABC transport system permease protein
MGELPLAWSYLRGRPIRSAMTVLSIVVGVMIMFGLNGMAPALKDLFISNTQSVALANVDLYVTRKDGSFFQEAYWQQLGEVQGVASTAPMFVRAVPLPADRYQTADGNDITTINVYGVDPDVTDEAFNAVTAGGRRLVSGRTLQPGDQGNLVLISEQFAEGLGLGVGDVVDLPGAGGWTPFQVIGLLDDPGLLLGNQQVFMPIAAAQNLLNKPNRINIILGRYAEGVDARAMDAGIQSMFGRGYELSPLEGGADIWAALLEFMNVIFTMFGLFSLALAGLIMFNTFRTSVVERRRDIGLLRAVGAKRNTVLRVILYEGLILAISGTILGILFGFAFAFGARALLGGIFESLMGQTLSQPRFDALTYLASILFGLGIPLASILLPARSASRTTPLEAMRPQTVDQEASVRRGRLVAGSISLVLGLAGLASGIFPLMALGVMLFLLALGLLGPLVITPITSFFDRALRLVFGQEGSLAAGNIARQPRRAAITTTTLMISLAILIGLGGMLASVYGGALRYLDDSLRSDYIMIAGSLIVTNDTVGAGPELAQNLRRLPGVAELTTMRQIDVLDEQGIGIRLVGIEPAGYARIAGLSFLDGDSSAFDRLTNGGAAIINGRYASQFGATVGDTITLDGDHGPAAVEVVAIGLDYLNIKLPTIYLDQASLAREYGVRNDVLILINSEPGVDREQLEQDLQAATSRFPGFGILSRAQLRASQENVARSGTIGMNIMLALLALPALLGLANALGINVIERTREIGMLRAVGARRRQVWRMVIAESLLLSLMGIAFGVVGGVFLSMVLTEVLDFAGLHIPYQFPLAGVITAIAVGLLCGVLAALIPARRASDLEIVSALAYE